MASEIAEEEVEDSPEEELDPLQAQEIETAKWKDQALRNAAELENFRKRMSREKLDAVVYGNQRLLEELLPVLDNFDMGMQAAEAEKGSMLYAGMDMVRKQIYDFLSNQNVKEMPTEEGNKFDPAFHEAVSLEASEDHEEESIIRVVRKGYKMGERLLRPTNVIVTQNVAEEDDQSQTEEQ